MIVVMTRAECAPTCAGFSMAPDTTSPKQFMGARRSSTLIMRETFDFPDRRYPECPRPDGYAAALGGQPAAEQRT